MIDTGETVVAEEAVLDGALHAAQEKVDQRPHVGARFTASHPPFELASYRGELSEYGSRARADVTGCDTLENRQALDPYDQSRQLRLAEEPTHLTERVERRG